MGFNFKDLRWHKVFGNTIRLLLVGAIIGNIFSQNWFNLFTSSLALFATYFPFILAEKNHLQIPPGFQIVILFFVFASMYLGELKEYYFKFWWWDMMLHALSGIILGIIGFILVYLLNQEEEIDVVLSPIFVAIFSFAFSVSIGALWEIFEFSMDSMFGLNMQKPMGGLFFKTNQSALIDTMWDLIVDSLGALAASIVGYIYMKKDISYFKEIAHYILKENSD